jgi:hypothetical protein
MPRYTSAGATRGQPTLAPGDPPPTQGKITRLMIRPVRRLSLVCALVAVLLGTGCVSAPPLETALRAPAPAPVIRFGVDTFAFPNEVRSKNHGKPDLFAHWCFVMVRAVTQFHRFARFDPAGPRLSSNEYVERVSRVTARPPWDPASPPAERVAIPGYASLYEFSRAEEPAVKAGLGGRFWTWIHWTNWRVVFPMPGAQQEGVVRETLEELHARRPVQWLVTNFPIPELNHTVLAYDYRVVEGGAVEFWVYDPNDPAAPGTIRFDRAEQRFWATRVHDTAVGPIRAFRMYYGPFL